MTLLPGDFVPLWDLTQNHDLHAFEYVTPEHRDPACTKCGAGEAAEPGQRCIKPGVLGDSGPAMLVVGNWPTTYEAKKGEPFLGAYGRKIRGIIKECWPGRAVYDYAIKCPVGDMKPSAVWYSECRPYLTRTARFFKYDRVLLLGREAARAFLGRPVDVDSVERPWAWSTKLDAPIFIGRGIRSAYNTLFEREMYAQVEWACTAPRPQAPPFATAKGRRVAPELTDEILAWAARAPEEFVLDYEAEGRMYDTNYALVSAALAHEACGDLVWLWCRADLVEGSQMRDLLVRILRTRPMTAHNKGYEIQASRRGLRLAHPLGGACTLQSYKLLKGNAFVGLDVLQDAVGMGGSKDELGPYLSTAKAEVLAEAEAECKASVDPEGSRKRHPVLDNPEVCAYGRVPERPLARYNGRDTLTTMYLRKYERERLKTDRDGVFETAYKEHVGPLTEVLAYMERTGMRAEKQHARDLQAYFGKRIAELEAQLAEWAPINWGSGPQIAEFLYNDMGLPIPWRTESGAPSTDKHALSKLKELHPVPDLILQRRRLSTLSTTYAWGIERFIQADGRVHTSFKAHGSETGRPTSSRPNQQNTPKGKDPDGKRIKDLYLASKGRRLVVFDHKTLEVRLAAGLSNDARMLEVIRSGIDFHLAAAKLIARLFGLDPNDITKDHWLRDTAKTLVFALLYGKSDNTAADDLDVEVAIAAGVRAGILGEFVRLAGWIDESHAEVRRDGGVWTLRSEGKPTRFRPLPAIYSRSKKEVAYALRAAVNTKVQGGGANVNNEGLIACYQWLMKTNMHKHVSMPLAVHDMICFDADVAAVDDVLDVVPMLMCSFDYGVPLGVDASVGERLGSCEPVKLG